VNQNVECIKLKVSIWAGMLQGVERHPTVRPIATTSPSISVIRLEILAGAGNLRKPGCESVSTARPSLVACKDGNPKLSQRERAKAAQFQVNGVFA
jgi:hypothetical protein